ncbi:hypothetical protein T06_8537 [Trichinella sp. T6]|nr:hypothetical protein T06_8537 [Trichinella sp. T6]
MWRSGTSLCAGRFFCALMMTLAVSVSYDHREQEQTIFRYHRIEHIEEQYDGPSMIFLLAGVQPYEVVQIVCTRHYVIRTAQSNLQFVFLFWRGSFVMRMVDNSESQFLFPGTLLISCINRCCISYQNFLRQLHTSNKINSAHCSYCRTRQRLPWVVYPPHHSTAYSEWCNCPPLLHRPLRVVYPPATPPPIQSEWCNRPPLLHRPFRVVYPPTTPPHIQSGVIARHSSTAHSEWYTRPPSLHRIFRVV